jgi:hypothetical protein
VTELDRASDIQRRRLAARAFNLGLDHSWVRFPEEVNLWWVCDEYHIEGNHVDARYHLTPVKDEFWRSYRPLEETPDLFLEFARLHEEADFDQAALAWSRKYGLPGANSLGSSNARCDETSMNLEWFREEAQRAWVILTMYEAALKRDTQSIELVLNTQHDSDLGFWPVEIDEGNFSESELIRLALFLPFRMVEGTVAVNCRHILIVEGSQHPPDPSKAKGVWEFRSLLGAAYLQAYLLMASGGSVALCEQCGRIISLARSHPQGRKRRRDRKFCDDACRQAHHRSKKKA